MAFLLIHRKLEKQKEKKRKEEQKRKIASLSFNPDDGEEEEEEEEELDCKCWWGTEKGFTFKKKDKLLSSYKLFSNSSLDMTDTEVKKKKLGKNPDVDTSFLPDRDREVGKC